MTKTDLLFYIPKVEAIISNLTLDEKMFLLHQDLTHMSAKARAATDAINIEIVEPYDLHLESIHQLFMEVWKQSVKSWKAEQEYQKYKTEVTK